MIENDIAQVIRDELRAQRKPIDFDLDLVVRAIVAELESGYPEVLDDGDA